MSAGRAAVRPILQAALPYIQQYGFTSGAIREALKGAPQLASADTSPAQISRALSVLFPGPDAAPTSAPRRLFGMWDSAARERYIVGSEDTAFGAISTRVPANEAFDGAVALLQRRLVASGDVQSHLLRVCITSLRPH